MVHSDSSINIRGVYSFLSGQLSLSMNDRSGDRAGINPYGISSGYRIRSLFQRRLHTRGLLSWLRSFYSPRRCWLSSHTGWFRSKPLSSFRQRILSLWASFRSSFLRAAQWEAAHRERRYPRRHMPLCIGIGGQSLENGLQDLAARLSALIPMRRQRLHEAETLAIIRYGLSIRRHCDNRCGFAAPFG
jgi:hypothetical protein